MKKQLLLGCALSALIEVSPALAQMMGPPPPPPPPPPPAPVYNWTGWYVGGNVGYSWGRGAPTFTGSALGTSLTGPGNLDGVIGGVQIGYDWQNSATWVGGLEADFQWADEKNSGNFSATTNDCEGICSISGTIGSQIHWFDTVRGRLGWLYNPTTMVYGTAGVAYGKVSINGSLTNSCTQGLCATSPNGTFAFSSSSMNVGWTIGGGVRGIVPGAPAWVWKVEYLYIDLGTLNGSGFDPIFRGATVWNANFTDNILRFGLDYHFH
jgi:outer membrane immunogenic protein